MKHWVSSTFSNVPSKTASSLRECGVKKGYLFNPIEWRRGGGGRQNVQHTDVDMYKDNIAALNKYIR